MLKAKAPCEPARATTHGRAQVVACAVHGANGLREYSKWRSAGFLLSHSLLSLSAPQWMGASLGRWLDSVYVNPAFGIGALCITAVSEHNQSMTKRTAPAPAANASKTMDRDSEVHG